MRWRIMHKTYLLCAVPPVVCHVAIERSNATWEIPAALCVPMELPNPKQASSQAQGWLPLQSLGVLVLQCSSSALCAWGRCVDAYQGCLPTHTGRCCLQLVHALIVDQLQCIVVYYPVTFTGKVFAPCALPIVAASQQCSRVVVSVCWGFSPAQMLSVVRQEVYLFLL
jgi:hypothetical protein